MVDERQKEYFEQKQLRKDWANRAEQAEQSLAGMREALERITVESVDITTPLKTLEALDQLRAIARQALSSTPDQEGS